MELSKDLRMFYNYRRLKEIKRCNNFPVVNKEDVAQHSYYVTLLAMALADEYNDYARDYNMRNPSEYVDHHKVLVKIELLLRKSLLHDTEESITSDIPWNVKHDNDETHRAIERAIASKVDSAYEGTNTLECYHVIGSECKQGLEGMFVDIADMMELSLYCYEEVVMGNHYIKPLLAKSVQLIVKNTLYPVLWESSTLFKSLVNLISADSREQLESSAERLLNVD